MNRILRMYAPSLIGDHTLCYLHSDSQGNSTVNEVPIKINYAHCGDELGESDCGEFLTLVLPAGITMENGDYLFVKEYETLLRWNEAEKSFEVKNNGFIGLSDTFEVFKPLKTAIIEIKNSDNTAARDLSYLVRKIAGEISEVTEVSNKDEFLTTLEKLTEEGISLIITSGCVGSAKGDFVPEAVAEAADKLLPGFGEAMRIKNLMSGPEVLLNRSMAAVKDRSLILCLPEDMKLASEFFNAVSSSIRPAAEQL